MNKITKRILLIIIILIVVFLIALPKLDLFSNTKEAKETSAAKPTGAQKIPVEVIVLKRQPLKNTVQVTGSIMANEMLELKAEASGIIQNIYFREGQNIKKGDLLLTIKNDDLLAQLEKLKYNRKLYEDMAYRQKQLLEREAISQEEYDIAMNQVKTTEAEMKVLEAQIAKTRLRAPFSGTIGLRKISEGSYVTTSTPIANFLSIEPVKIDFSIPGKYSNDIKVGDQISFTTESAKDVYTGEIYAIEPQIDPNTRTLKIRAVSPNKDRKLLPGQFAKVEITLQTLDNAIMVPSAAVIPELQGHKVYMLENGKIKEAKIDVGIRTNTEVQVLSGLTESDTVITTGILQVKPGSEVIVTNL